MGFGGAILLIAVGAIVRYALDVNVAGVDLDVVGLILMIAGGALLLLTLATMLFQNGGPEQPRQAPRQQPPR